MKKVVIIIIILIAVAAAIFGQQKKVPIEVLNIEMRFDVQEQSIFGKGATYEYTLFKDHTWKKVKK